MEETVPFLAFNYRTFSLHGHFWRCTALVAALPVWCSLRCCTVPPVTFLLHNFGRIDELSVSL
jgi:hypothetical protein